MKILLAPVGSRGDVQPLAALGQRLKAHGHEVAIATHPNFEGWIRSLDLGYHAMGINLEAVLVQESHASNDNPLKTFWTFSKIFLSIIESQFRELHAIAKGY